jgi:hypothetical protein
MSPEASGGAVVWVAREEGRPVEGLVDVLDDDEGLADGAVVTVEEDGNLLVDGIVLQQQLALVLQVFMDELVRYALEAKGSLGAVHDWAAERADELDRRRHRSSALVFSLARVLLAVTLGLNCPHLFIAFLQRTRYMTSVDCY